MKKKRYILSILFLVGALLIINPPVFGQQQYVMKFGLAGAPDINPTFWATHYNMFEYEVEKRSNGRIQVELIRGALGSPTDRMKQVMMGQIQGADTAEGPIAQVYKPVQVFSIPYLLETEQQAWRLFDGPFVQNLTEDLRKKTGLKVLHWWESGGFKQWTNSKRPIRTPSDMKGLKIRVMPSPVFQKLVSSLGGSPTPISFGELYGALKNKIVDGQNNALSLVNLFKYYQVQKYVTIDNHVYAISSMVSSDKWYQSLPEALQKVIFVEQFPRTTVDVYLEILQAEAGTRCAALTVASVALADAGIPMRALVPSCAAGKINGQVVLDLGRLEDNKGDEP